ncbi:MAG TPA: hypothetical protein VFG23_18525, partial [Polyangia bacterium]|nr:hypothetical protein [Polyangia bacterium]
MSEAQASALLSALRARPASPLLPGLAQEFANVGGTLTPQFSNGQGATPARVSLPSRSTAAVHIEDTATAVGIDVTLRDARDSVGRAADGLVVYAHAHVSGATLIHRPGPGGDHVRGLGDDLGGDAGIETRVVAVVARGQDFGVGDVQDLGGDGEAG